MANILLKPSSRREAKLQQAACSSKLPELWFVGDQKIHGFALYLKEVSSLGELGGETFADNTDAWSGDHGMDHTTVPGVLFVDRQFKQPATSLKNLAASILAEYEIDEFPSSAPAN